MRNQQSCNRSNKNITSVAVVARNTTICVGGEHHPFASYDKVVVQSDEVMVLPTDISSESTLEHDQTVSFLDSAVGTTVEAPSATSVVAKVDGTMDASLGAFLSRPVKIDAFAWTNSDVGVFRTITPWHAFMNDTAVKKKLDNFAFFRGKLHLKILINGTPFEYGLMRVAYQPMKGWDASRIRTNTTSDVPLLIPYSQLPGFYVSPSASAGGELECPFFYHHNWLAVGEATTIQSFGSLFYVVYYPLSSAVASGLTTATVTTFAWMTDVELMGPTSGLAVQSDEYVEGPISGPATAVASAASMLTKIPIIGKFARATEIGAKSAASIARLFGYTNVPVIDDVRAFQPMNGPMLASAHISVPAQKLTFDPKQELSIDPTLHGLADEDELSLAYLKTKDSYLTGTSWATTDALGTVLFNMRVNPHLFANIPIENTSSAVVAQRVYHTPISYVSEMFRSWRGGLRVRIRIVATKFHKGRLKIQYDPWNNISQTAVGENLVYTEIIDIGETNEVEFVIPYHQALSWSDVEQDVATPNWTLGDNMQYRPYKDNGTLTISVLNTLVAPIAGSIGIMVFVRGADDLEWANPMEHVGGITTYYKVPSFYAVQSDEEVVKPFSKTLGHGEAPSSSRYHQHYGENIASLRTVLHRSSLTDIAYFAPSGNALHVLGKRLRILPCSPGFDGNSTIKANKVVAASGTAGYSFTNMHPMSWVSRLYGGFRGSATFTVTPGADARNGISNVMVQRVDDVGAGQNTWFDTTLTAPTTVSQGAALLNNGVFGSGCGGLAITSTQTNGSLNFNVPFFSRYNFALTYPAADGHSIDDTDRMSVQVTAFVNTGAANNDVTYACAQCAGPDFTCLFFLCCPTVDYLKNRPTPSSS